MSNEKEYKEKIRANLEMVLGSGFIPEIGEHKTGKVRDVHFSEDNIVMVASDRVSCFDHVLSRCIPYKGVVLNLFNQWAMNNTADIIPNVMAESPDPSVIVQRKLKNVGFECVVRGYVWGSLAGDYEKGKREKSGVTLPQGLLRYEKLQEPMFTPATKAEEGHDEDISLERMAEVLGRDMAEKVRDVSVQLYLRGVELAEKAGMIFIDTKFEFGTDEEGNLYLIDESLTPDSSRYCNREEYDAKWSQIAEAMKSGKYANVSELLKANPKLKIREESKQFVRDVLIEGGYEEGKPIPDLTDEQVIETAWRYINSYERLSGNEFSFAATELPNARQRIMNNLIKAGMAYGGCVVPIGASKKDEEHWKKIADALRENNVPYTAPFFGSAHKETRRVLDFVESMDRDSIEPLVYLTFAGRSNGLGPVVAGNTRYPVIACPPFKDTATYAVDIHSSLRMPSNLPLMTVVEPGNAVLAAKRIIDMVR
ncbi:AIR carboxylase family protein [Candidatus Woesearchaeota archaeon]|nr:AIR carboxylase family protein [Candidatus Woesearchaeota archaeon]